MLDLRAYRLGFAPALAALVIVAFSLQGVPDPLEPAEGTIEFDAGVATDTTRSLVRAAPDRRPGSEGAATAADFVRSRLEQIASGSVAEQRFEVSVDGEDVEAANVVLTLPGTSDRAILVVAERGTRSGNGIASSAAATGVLLELAAQLGVSGRERTLILASLDGAGAEGEGAQELVDALPGRTIVDAAVVISQPAAPAPAEPHLVVSSGGEDRPSQELIRTAEDTLQSRAQAAAGLDGSLGQVARLALPAAAGMQAALLSEGIDAVAVSGAGEAPLPADESDELSPESLERFGASTLALVGALDAAPPAGAGEPGSYVRLGGNTIPGWALALLALSLLIPPALPVALELARARRSGTARVAAGWAVEWALVGLAPLLGLYALTLLGLLPSPNVPFDPGRFKIGAPEVLAMLVLAGLAVAAWWALGLRRAPSGPDPTTLGAAAGAVCIAGCIAAWLANPFLALAMVPLAHVVMAHGTSGRRRTAVVVPLALAALLPLAAVVLHVAGTLDWGATTPWQLVVLVAGGGMSALEAASVAVALCAVAAVVRAALRSPRARPGGGRPVRS